MTEMNLNKFFVAVLVRFPKSGESGSPEANALYDDLEVVLRNCNYEQAFTALQAYRASARFDKFNIREFSGFLGNRGGGATSGMSFAIYFFCGIHPRKGHSIRKAYGVHYHPGYFEQALSAKIDQLNRVMGGECNWTVEEHASHKAEAHKQGKEYPDIANFNAGLRPVNEQQYSRVDRGYHEENATRGNLVQNSEEIPW